jgi:16S rRNA (guanine527-N7)-methyltransferase
MTVPWAEMVREADALGLPVTEEHLGQFDAFASLLAEGRQLLNLTSIVDPEEVAFKLFLDSLTALLGLVEALPEAARLIDIGTGAGFPGVPLAIVLPDAGVTLLDATGKKMTWLSGAVDTIGLRNAYPVAGRAETAAHDPGWRGQFDVAVVRAVAPIAVLAEICLPFLCPGGQLIALKSATRTETELPEARYALQMLGGRVASVMPVRCDRLPNRVVVTIVQDGRAPRGYPRRPGVPATDPLIG